MCSKKLKKRLIAAGIILNLFAVSAAAAAAPDLLKKRSLLPTVPEKECTEENKLGTEENETPEDLPDVPLKEEERTLSGDEMLPAEEGGFSDETDPGPEDFGEDIPSSSEEELDSPPYEGTDAITPVPSPTPFPPMQPDDPDEPSPVPLVTPRPTIRPDDPDRATPIPLLSPAPDLPLPSPDEPSDSDHPNESPTINTGVIIWDGSYEFELEIELNVPSAPSSRQDETDTIPVSYTSNLDTFYALADRLSNLTGFQYSLTFTQTPDGLVVSWSSDSSLFDSERQTSELWLMLDMLANSLRQELGVQNILYTIPDSYALQSELAPAFNGPYLGSTYYKTYGDERPVSPEQAEVVLQFYLDSMGIVHTSMTFVETESQSGLSVCIFDVVWPQGTTYIQINEKGFIQESTYDEL